MKFAQCVQLCDPMDYTVHGILQARILEWVAFLFSRDLPTQGSNPGLPHCTWILYQLSHKGSPRILEWVVYPISSKSSQPRNWTRVSCIAGRFFTRWATKEAFFVAQESVISMDSRVRFSRTIKLDKLLLSSSAVRFKRVVDVLGAQIHSRYTVCIQKTLVLLYCVFEIW